jgi:hypothetical protein
VPDRDRKQKGEGNPARRHQTFSCAGLRRRA